MTTEDDLRDDPKDADEPATGGAPVRAEQLGSVSIAESDGSGSKGPSSDALAKSSASDEEEEEEEDEFGAPAQLGSQRFVFAAYFAGGIAIAFLLSKAISYGWTRLSLWKPMVGEPHDELVMPLAALVGAGVAFYYYRDEQTRTLAEEVASELGQVSWPSRDEVVNSTFVVVVTTFVATAFFALMDRFWGFVTNLVYGA